MEYILSFLQCTSTPISQAPTSRNSTTNCQLSAKLHRLV